MAHVAFATNEDEASGFGGFPARVQRSDEIVEVGRFPLSLSRAVAVRMYWATKVWRIHGTVNNVVSGVTIGTVTFDFNATIGEDIGAASTISDETDLPLYQTIHSGDTNLSDPDIGQVSIEMFDAWISVTPDLDSSDIKPQFVVDLEAGGSLGRFGTSKNNTPYTHAAAVIAKIVIDGTDHSFTIYKDGDPGDLTGTLTVEPQTQWAYS